MKKTPLFIHYITLSLWTCTRLPVRWLSQTIFSWQVDKETFANLSSLTFSCDKSFS